VDLVFLVKVIISFFVAGIWISAATLLAERMGSKIGGLIAVSLISLIALVVYGH